jgi:hypothetical protein
MRTFATKIFAAAMMLGLASLSFAQAKPAAPNPVLTTPPNAGTGPSSSIGPSSAQGGPAIPGTSLGTTGVPNNVNTAPPATEGATRCNLLSGLEKDRCLRDSPPPASATVGTGSPDGIGPGSNGAGR